MTIPEKIHLLETRLDELRKEILVLKNNKSESEKQVVYFETLLSDVRVQNTIYKDRAADIISLEKQIKALNSDISKIDTKITEIEKAIVYLDNQLPELYRKSIDNEFRNETVILQNMVESFDYASLNKVKLEIKKLYDGAMNIFSKYSNQFKYDFSSNNPNEHLSDLYSSFDNNEKMLRPQLYDLIEIDRFLNKLEQHIKKVNKSIPQHLNEV